MIVELIEAAAMLAITAGAVLVVLSIGVRLSPAAPRPTAGEVPPTPMGRAAGVPEPPQPGPAMLPNTIDVGGRRYLRAVAGSGSVLHLVPQADGATEAWPALGAHAGDDAPGMPGYDDALMHLRVWNVRTMCGLRWAAMASHDVELRALIARAVAPARPGNTAASYVCPVCAARVEPGRSAARGRG